MKKIHLISGILINSAILISQNNQLQDTLKSVIQLKEVEVESKSIRNQISRLQDVENVYIHTAKKNDVINLSKFDADLSINNTRQVFSKVAGINIWENDGSGIQIGVATRGLSPNRSWEFNVRQNGYDIAAELFGYPEAYFNPPLEAVEKIVLIRGGASLQYGPQFGGLLNYIIKRGSPNKSVELESYQTYGSYNLFNSFNAIGGTIGKLSYYAYFHHRSAEGWRQNSRYYINTGYISLEYAINSKNKITFDYTKMNYLNQQAGGLTDSLFYLNHKKSIRSRNWFNVPWNVMDLNYNYKISDNSILDVKLFGNFSERNSVGFLTPINIPDTFNTTINSFNPRQVDRDQYNNLGTELRYLQKYKLFNQQHSLALGVRAYKGRTLRRQKGIGSSGFDFDLNICQLQNDKKWGRDLELQTLNYAFFLENSFNIGPKWSIVPGIRYEVIHSFADGYINPSNGNISLELKRNVLLFGIGSQYKITSTTNFYANFSQAYRPVLFSDLTPPSTTAIIDPDLKDASGFTLDGGYRGNIQDFLTFDLSIFYLIYDNRIGTIKKDGVDFRTNIGTSESKGVETFIEIDPIRYFTKNSPIGYITLSAAYSYINAVYTKWNNPNIINDPKKSILGKKVEYAPENIERYSISYQYKGFSITGTLSKVSDFYTDAANTIEPSKSATTGIIKGYQVIDVTSSLNIKQYTLKFGINNLLDEKYATRRAGGYPGPGLIPGNGRTLFITVGAKF